MEATQALEDIQPASERTQTLHVTERIVAENREVEKESIVFVRPLPFRRWATALSFIVPMMAYIPENGLGDDEGKIYAWAASLVGVAHENLFALAKLATDKDDEFFDRIDLDDGIAVIQAVVTVNKSFFVSKVLPMLEEMVPGTTERLAKIFGPTPLPS